MTRVSLDFSAVDRQAELAFKQTMLLLGRQFTQAITSNIWDWPNPPSPRNIINTGRLRSSQQLTFPAPGQALFAWPVDYALYVHQGYTMSNGAVFPGRPWTTYALNNFNVPRVYQQVLQLNPSNE
ncbi:MAG TPA: hypothetical protein VK203_21865 [Nostocaceae cyanobacterium]|nr:hypothetical protein [Nostocaceae cyanobacterium]